MSVRARKTAANRSGSDAKQSISESVELQSVTTGSAENPPTLLIITASSDSRASSGPACEGLTRYQH
jgi:hypothetical protein